MPTSNPTTCPPPLRFSDLPMALLLLYVDVVVRDAASEDGNARWGISKPNFLSTKYYYFFLGENMMITRTFLFY